MSDSRPEVSLEQEARSAALKLGSLVVGRELTADEAEAMAFIFKASAEALRHGFIKRLAEHVRSERVDESVEEFFEQFGERLG